MANLKVTKKLPKSYLKVFLQKYYLFIVALKLRDNLI